MPALIATVVLLVVSAAFGQTSVQNFGTGTGSQTSQTGSTSFLPNPTSGTTWARAGATAPNAPIVLANTSNPLGTTGSYVRGVASTSTSVSKFSPMVGYTGSTEFYTSFKVLFGDSAAGNTATTGSWNFYQGNGAMYSDANDFTGAQVFTGLRFTYGAGGSVALTYRGGSAFVNTGLTQSTFSQGTAYTVEIVGNNKASGTINYTYNGNARSVAVQKFDLYINGTLVGDDLAEALLPSGSNVVSNTFIGISSASNAANVFVDDVITYNAVPAAIGTAPTPNLSINDVTLNEGNAGTQTFQFTVSLSSPAPSGGVTFDIATADGTATAPGDYTAKSLTSQTVPAGSSTYTFDVLVNGDTTFEPTETFFVNVTNVTGANVTDGQGLGTITNDDAEPTPDLSVNDVSLAEGNAGTQTFQFTVSLSSPAPTGGVTFDIGTSNGSAAAGSDYVANALTGQTIPAGSSTYNFNVTVNGDTDYEEDESFFVNVTNVVGANVTGENGIGTGTIINDDTDTEPPAVNYTPLPAKATASSSELAVFAFDNDSVESVTITYTIGNGTPQTVPCSPGKGPYICTIDETGGDNQSVSYSVKATDFSGNSTTNPAIGNNGYGIGTAVIQGGTYDTLNILNGSLNGNVIVNSTFNYTGILTTFASLLELGCNVSIDPGNDNKFINGNLIKHFCSPQTFVYPLGTLPQSQFEPSGVQNAFYSPLTVNVTSLDGESSLKASATDMRMPGADPSNSITRYWTLTESGFLTADLTFQYTQNDVVGNESSFKVIKNENGTTTSFADSTVNTANHTATVTGISDFSQWSVGLLAPLAANASVGGRVLTSAGQGIRNAKVTITGGNLPEPQIITTGSFGYYQFDNLEVGQTYIITVNSQRYVFSNPTSVITLQEDIAEYNFTAQPF